MRHLTCDPDAEVLGRTILLLLRGLNTARLYPLLEKHSLLDIQPEEWYSCRDWLGFINELAETAGFTGIGSLVAIGLKIAEYQIVPPELENASLGQMLEMWDKVYQMNHRGDVGTIETVKISDTHYKCIHKNVYPDDLHYGVAYGMARRYLPPGTEFTVKYDEDILAMDRGGDQTIIHVMWS